MLAALLALTAAALFTGAAIYISVAEHPARLGLADSAALAQWQPSYKAAVPMQAGLAVAAAALGVSAWLDTGDACMLIGALLIFAVVPFTFFVIMPTNKRMLATAPDAADAGTRAMLVRWGQLHWVRNLLGVASVAAFLLCLLRL
jgi:uncharacterized membrane protein